MIMIKEVETFVVSISLENSHFIMVSALIYGVLIYGVYEVLLN